MAILVKWDEPSDLTIGSVHIWKSDTGYSGSYWVEDTIESTSDGLAKTNLNTWVTQYNDVAGSTTDFYKVQFNSIYGDGGLSLPININLIYHLTTVDKVKRVSRLLNEFERHEIFDFIVDAEDEIFYLFGKPVSKMWTGIEDGEHTYNIDQWRKPIWSIDRVEADGSFIDPGSYTIDYNGGAISLSSDTVTQYQGDRLEVEWTPKIYNKLCTLQAAFELLDANGVITNQRDVVNTAVLIIRDRMDRVYDDLKPRQYIRSTQFQTYDPRKGIYVQQEFGNEF